VLDVGCSPDVMKAKDDGPCVFSGGFTGDPELFEDRLYSVSIPIGRSGHMVGDSKFCARVT
jgi:hypothetical protein